MVILGIETSCDETSAAVVRDGRLLSNIISSQLVHSRYGGVVPELASRAHERLIIPVVGEALSAAGVMRPGIDAVAVTYGPGLMGSLLVGLNFAKALALGLNVPFVGVNHLEGHLYSNFLTDSGGVPPEYPFVCLIVSGGHTQVMLVSGPFEHRLLGTTSDDAAGEAYDKVAKMLGLDYPGGPAIDAAARGGNPDFVRFPRPYLRDHGYDFSFSGLKTAVLYYLRDAGLLKSDLLKKNTGLLSDICASFQAAVVEVLTAKTIGAAREYGVRDVAVAGGVSANSGLRRAMAGAAGQHGLRLHIPSPQYCTDNGAMVAYTGWMKIVRGITSPLTLTAAAHIE